MHKTDSIRNSMIPWTNPNLLTKKRCRAWRTFLVQDPPHQGVANAGMSLNKKTANQYFGINKRRDAYWYFRKLLDDWPDHPKRPQAEAQEYELRRQGHDH